MQEFWVEGGRCTLRVRPGGYDEMWDCGVPTVGVHTHSTRLTRPTPSILRRAEP